jgi:hypothetical protein
MLDRAASQTELADRKSAVGRIDVDNRDYHRPRDGPSRLFRRYPNSARTKEAETRRSPANVGDAGQHHGRGRESISTTVREHPAKIISGNLANVRAASRSPLESRQGLEHLLVVLSSRNLHPSAGRISLHSSAYSVLTSRREARAKPTPSVARNRKVRGALLAAPHGRGLYT